MPPALFEDLSSHVTHDRENSSWVVQGVNLRKILPISKSSCNRRFQLCLATLENRVIQKLEECAKDIKIIVKQKV